LNCVLVDELALVERARGVCVGVQQTSGKRGSDQHQAHHLHGDACPSMPEESCECERRLILERWQI
jgi:hypothetical protein